MSYYGYNDAVSQGTQFSAKTKAYNDAVLTSNQVAVDSYKQTLKNQPSLVSGDNTNENVDDALYGSKEGAGLVGTGVGVYGAAKGISAEGLVGHVASETRGRMNTIGNSFNRLRQGDPAPAVVDMGTEMDTFGNTGAEVSSGLDAGATAGASAGREIESTGILAKGIKSGVNILARGKIGEAGLSAISEIGGKAIGDFSGVVDVADSFKNLADGKNVFSGESTADKFQEAGAVADIVGTAFPPLEVVGGALNLIGGVMSAVTDLEADHDKKKADATTVPPPKETATKISPAFQSLGLVASQVPSAKTSIVGGGSF
tara:strand:+ start:6680 stop:7624 length:945 start_codon:yes stop_codon:yes gene_type:complete